MSKSNIELDCKWHFAEWSGGRTIGPCEPMQENFKETPYASLIREAIQNSLDVPLDKNKPVRMEFSIHYLDSLNYPDFFELRDHISGCQKSFKGVTQADAQYPDMLERIDKASQPGQRLYFIRISDYNTTGMRYNPDALTEALKGEFHAFVRAVGLSDKNYPGAGGSFGFGKAAYFYISPIRTLIVFTKNREGKIYFEGVSALATHSITKNGLTKKYVDAGFYDNNNGNPVTDLSQIPNRLCRKPDESGEIPCGTDINIMGIDLESRTKESIYEELQIALLENFWLAIHENRLIVTIGDTIFSKENLSEKLEEIFNDLNSKKFDEDPRPFYDAVVNAGQDDKHFVFDFDYLNYNIPTKGMEGEKLKRKLGEIKFYLAKTRTDCDKIFYARNPRMRIYTKKLGHLGFVGVFVCSKYQDSSEGIFNEIFSMIENPAHNKWIFRNFSAPRGSWVDDYFKYARIVHKNFVDDCINSVFKRDDSDTSSIRGLDQYLYIPTTDENPSDDTDVESTMGDPTGNIKDTGSSPTTSIGNEHDNKSKASNNKPGMVLDPKTGKIENNPNGEGITGRSKKGGGGGGGYHTTDDPKERVKPSENGKQGEYLIPIRADYRTFAQIEDETVSHILVIHLKNEVLNGRIDIIVCGEESDVELNLSSSSQGECKRNTIRNLHLNEGKNVIRVKFSDNAKHSLKLKAYEIK